ncbi:hypothetical protein HPP92_027726 [Vanilla planifolia]|uniref:Uncharacterized protein n=1 Tax=Vanilla planifolia TaxID=51239 RepID=A0A835P8U3_VANPL|nr:hypothetical protein HPP92_027726 [Vanilla planifolia]
MNKLRKENTGRARFPTSKISPYMLMRLSPEGKPPEKPKTRAKGAQRISNKPILTIKFKTIWRITKKLDTCEIENCTKENRRGHRGGKRTKTRVGGVPRQKHMRRTKRMQKLTVFGF